jgi:hypothetical protein
MRKNAFCGPLRQGQGRVWASTRHNNVEVQGNFMPYVWLSNDRHGLCYLADSDRNWKLDPAKPALTLDRKGRTLALSLHLINKPTRVAEPLVYEFVLQATPVKPMIQGWRLAGLSGGRPELPGQRQDLQFLWFNWGTPGRWAIDKTYVKSVEQANQAGAHSCIYNNWKAFPYSLNTVDPAAVQSYLGDWAGSAMVETLQDAVLYQADRLLAAGEIGGIYCDDTYPHPSRNVMARMAYVMDNGTIQPGFGELSKRQYVRRVAHMLEKHGKRPGLWIHDTDALVVPWLAFADVSMDGEHYPLTTLRPDFIDKWPFERLRAGARGEKIGTVPFWLPMVKMGYRKEDTAVRTKLTRTFLGPMLLHDYITDYRWAGLENDVVLTVQKAKLTFGIGADAVEFCPYWENGKIVKPGDPSLFVSYYRNGAKLLMTVVNTSEDAVDGTVAVDFATLGINTPTVTNAETGEAMATRDGQIPVSIPYHDFLLLSIQ